MRELVDDLRAMAGTRYCWSYVGTLMINAASEIEKLRSDLDASRAECELLKAEFQGYRDAYCRGLAIIDKAAAGGEEKS